MTVLSHFVYAGSTPLAVAGCYFTTLTFNGCNEYRFGLCSMQLYYCFICKSFHAGTRHFCHILFMLVSGCYFSIWFITAAMNIDSAFALCIKLTYCFQCKSFHVVTRQFCHILLMMVPHRYL